MIGIHTRIQFVRNDFHLVALSDSDLAMVGN